MKKQFPIKKRPNPERRGPTSDAAPARMAAPSDPLLPQDVTSPPGGKGDARDTVDMVRAGAALQLARAQLMVSPLAWQGWLPFFSLLPFTTAGDEWVELLDDGWPSCRQKTLANTGDQPMQFEVTWDRQNNPIETFTVPPRSSLIIVCAVRKLRVKGPPGKRGNWEETETVPSGVVQGNGTLFTNGGTRGELDCRTFEVRNAGRMKVKIKMTRTQPRPNEEDEVSQQSEITVHPGNTIVLKCKISRLDVERDPSDLDGTTSVREVRT